MTKWEYHDERWEFDPRAAARIVLTIAAFAAIGLIICLAFIADIFI